MAEKVHIWKIPDPMNHERKRRWVRQAVSEKSYSITRMNVLVASRLFFLGQAVGDNHLKHIITREEIIPSDTASVNTAP